MRCVARFDLPAVVPALGRASRESKRRSEMSACCGSVRPSQFEFPERGRKEG